VKTDKLIDLLAQDSAVRWKIGRILGFATIGGAVIAGAAFFIGIGFRSDIASAVETVRFLFKFVVTLSLATAAIGALLRIARPGAPLGFWGWAFAAAPVLLGGAVIAELVAVPESAWAARLVGQNSRFCLTLIPLLAIGPLVCLLLALRQGAPSRPGLAGAIAGLAASGIAATFYAANCTDDSPLFVMTWYPIATAIVVLVGYLAGTKFLKW
jgi:hypothetical protein